MLILVFFSIEYYQLLVFNSECVAISYIYNLWLEELRVIIKRHGLISESIRNQQVQFIISMLKYLFRLFNYHFNALVYIQKLG
jgi:hypothetical protein